MLQSKRSPQSTERCMPKHHELHKKGSKFNEDKENTIPDTLVASSKLVCSPRSSSNFAKSGDPLPSGSLKSVTPPRSSPFKIPLQPFSPELQRCYGGGIGYKKVDGLPNANQQPSSLLIGDYVSRQNGNLFTAENESKTLDICAKEETDVHQENCNSDGFDICRLKCLDTETGSPVSVVSEKQTDCDSPFLGSLIHSKMVISMEDEVTQKLKAAAEGSSPLLSSQSSVFGRYYSSIKLKRCSSMFEQQESKRSEGLKSVIKRPLPFFEDLDDHSDKIQSKKQKLNEDSVRPTCSKVNTPIPTFGDQDGLNLTADSSRRLLLPTILGNSKNRDLNNIDSSTLADLINGKFQDHVESYRIIDARFVYEFEGGHIRGAVNFGSWNEEDFLTEFFPPTLIPKSSQESVSESDNSPKRQILIVHCEFSSVRGPKLIRFLRERDRYKNRDSYPALHYPEVYLLHGGYKAFFSIAPHLCEPQSYIPMNHPGFIKEERKFHKRSRTWQAGGSVARTNHLQLTRGRSICDLDRHKRPSNNSPCPGKKSLFKDI